MTRPLLHVEGLVKRFGGLVANGGVDLEVEAGEIHAVIGPNGAGKTTLVAQLAGDLRPDSGRIVFDGREITRLASHRRALLGLARSFQITSILPGFSAAENVGIALQPHAGHSFRFWRRADDDPALAAPALELLARVGLEDRAATPAGILAHGEKRQLELAMALAGKPRLLLLDEPMAGMGLEESARMVAFLRTLKGGPAILLVEHDMDAVFALGDRITVLVDGRALATGAPEAIRSHPEVRAAYLGEAA
ncbi:ABC transporter ATP-binding protein [Inquilinus sp. CAU 1745]|uniref:ABC transporter ATP-binding protein n=1 Tax=Inquilinus sp. CAU 1745 TaxID=3140369 RepID=UPI00325B4E82